jgi:hypothetical protein
MKDSKPQIMWDYTATNPLNNSIVDGSDLLIYVHS